MTQKLKEPKVLIPEVKIQARVQELGREISQDYRGQELTAICILKGSFIFFSDLIRAIETPLTCEFIGVSSYGGQMVTSGEVKMTLDVTEPLEGKNLLIIEDIVDSGLTLKYLLTNLATRRPKSIRCVSLLHKTEATRTQITLDYVGFKIGNEFVIGYGLDHNEKYRGLPYIGYIENEH